MSARQAADLYSSLEASGVRCWVMGGWGVDALLGRQTREHKDLDLLVHVEDLNAYRALVQAEGFERAYAWSESRTVTVGAERHDSAFVDAHPDGRQIDVHLIDIDDDGAVDQLSDDPWPLPENALEGRGMLGGTAVRCVTSDAQSAMHSTYDLPDKHREDVEALNPQRDVLPD